MSFLLGIIVHTPLLALFLGPLVTKLGDELHVLWSWLGKQSPLIKQLAAVVLAFALVLLANVGADLVPSVCANTLQYGISSDCQAALTEGKWLQVVLTTLVAIAVKHGKQAAKAKGQ